MNLNKKKFFVKENKEGCGNPISVWRRFLNIYKIKISLNILFFKEHNIEIDEKYRQQSKREIKNLKCFYNFFTNSIFEFRSTIFSDNKNSILVNFKDVSFEVETKIKTLEEEPVLEEVIDFHKLQMKRKKICSFLKMTCNTFNNIIQIKSLGHLSKQNFYECAECAKICKSDRGLQIHRAWHKKQNK